MWKALFGGTRSQQAHSSAAVDVAARFSLRGLTALHTALLREKNAPPSSHSDARLIETIKELSELMVYGDKHDEKFFEFFGEKSIMKTFVEIFRERSPHVKTQIIQTVSIILMNIQNQRSLFYLLSNNHVNELISCGSKFRAPPDHDTAANITAGPGIGVSEGGDASGDEELLAYWISFLKTLSLSANASTVHFFYCIPRPGAMPAFHLYTEAIRYFAHPDSMVRTSVRTITLTVYQIRDAAVRGFLVHGDNADYPLRLATHLKGLAVRISALLNRINVTINAVEDPLSPHRISLHDFVESHKSAAPRTPDRKSRWLQYTEQVWVAPTSLECNTLASELAQTRELTSLQEDDADASDDAISAAGIDIVTPVPVPTPMSTNLRHDIGHVDEQLCEISDTLYYIADIFAIHSREDAEPPSPTAGLPTHTPNKKNRSAIPENISFQPFCDVLVHALDDLFIRPVLIHGLQAAAEVLHVAITSEVSTLNDTTEGGDTSNSLITRPRKRASSGGLAGIRNKVESAAAEVIDLPLAMKVLAMIMRIIPYQSLLERLVHRLVEVRLPAPFAASVTSAINSGIGGVVTTDGTTERTLLDVAVAFLASPDQRVATSSLLLLHALADLASTKEWARTHLQAQGLWLGHALNVHKHKEITLMCAQLMCRLPLPNKLTLRLSAALIAKLCITPLNISLGEQRTSEFSDGEESEDMETSAAASQPPAATVEALLSRLCAMVKGLGNVVNAAIQAARATESGLQLSSVLHALEYASEKELSTSLVMPEIIKRAYPLEEAPPLAPGTFELLQTSHEPGKALVEAAAANTHKMCNDTLVRMLQCVIPLNDTTDQMAGLVPLPGIPYITAPLDDDSSTSDLPSWTLQSIFESLDASAMKFAQRGVEKVTALVTNDALPAAILTESTILPHIMQLLLTSRALLAGLRSTSALGVFFEAAASRLGAQVMEKLATSEERRIRRCKREFDSTTHTDGLAERSLDLVPRYVWEGHALHLDPLLRVFAPPLDSIRNGETFSVARLTRSPAVLYPTSLPSAAPPIGLPSLDPVHDVEHLLATMAATAKHVQVVLGALYLVIGDTPPKSLRSSSSVDSPMAYAVAVFPMHFTYVSVPPSYPNAVEVRVIMREPAPVGEKLSLGGGGAHLLSPSGNTAGLHIAAFTLQMPNVDASAELNTYVNITRRKLLAAKFDVLPLLANTINFFEEPPQARASYAARSTRASTSDQATPAFDGGVPSVFGDDKAATRVSVDAVVVNPTLDVTDTTAQAAPSETTTAEGAAAAQEEGHPQADNHNSDTIPQATEEQVGVESITDVEVQHTEQQHTEQMNPVTAEEESVASATLPSAATLHADDAGNEDVAASIPEPIEPASQEIVTDGTDAEKYPAVTEDVAIAPAISEAVEVDAETLAAEQHVPQSTEENSALTASEEQPVTVQASQQTPVHAEESTTAPVAAEYNGIDTQQQASAASQSPSQVDAVSADNDTSSQAEADVSVANAHPDAAETRTEETDAAKEGADDVSTPAEEATTPTAEGDDHTMQDNTEIGGEQAGIESTHVQQAATDADARGDISEDLQEAGVD